MKTKLVILLLGFIMAIGCTSKKTKTITGWDAYAYNNAKELAVASKINRKFDILQAELFFVSTWNTPSYYSHSGEFTGIAYDGGTFLGIQSGDSVYFLFDREILSDDYVKQTGDSILTVEARIHKSGVSKDPRTTCWWIAAIQNNHTGSIDEFLENAVATPDKNQEILSPYIETLKENLSKMEGKSSKQKIINFTALSVKGSPESWDAWTWPGYYVPACPGFISAFEKYAEHENDVAVVEL